MRLFEGETIDENLGIADGNLSDLANEILWLLDFAVDDPPAQLSPFELSDCRKLLRLVVEDLPPVILAAMHARPESKPRCEGILGILAELRQRHPSADPSVWSVTFSAVATLRTYIEDVAGYIRSSARAVGPKRQPSPEPPIVPVGEQQADKLPEEGQSRRDEGVGEQCDYLFRLEGDFYRIRFQGIEASVKALKGLRHLAAILSQPHKPVFCVELESVIQGEALEWSELSESPLDEKAIGEYRERLSAVRRKLEALSKEHSSEEQGKLVLEAAWLEQELSRATDRKGQPKKINPTWEKSRKRVGNAIVRALNRLHRSLPVLEGHLRQNLDTGFLLVYRPSTEIEWHF